MTKSILIIIGLLISTNLLAQEIDPEERQTSQLTLNCSTFAMSNPDEKNFQFNPKKP